MSGALFQQMQPMPVPVPVPLATAKADEKWAELLAHQEVGEALAQMAASRPELEGALRGVFATSPYLTSLIESDPVYFINVLEHEPNKSVDDICTRLLSDVSSWDTEAAAMAALRLAKARAAMVIALADCGRIWDVTQTIEALTYFADAAVNAAANWLLLQAHRKGRIKLEDEATPGLNSGYVILAMGKMGAGELNYSSDIDLIVFYDLEYAPLADNVEPSQFFVRLTRNLVKLLQERTGEGYVFRTDLRLRPDPGATSVAISMEAAAVYYESLGQNWERAAMIKARAVAGDIAVGEEFLARLAPFIWRKYLDYAAIADVHAMKRQIHAHKGHSKIAINGHNIKLGRGGIREIEFFVQTQQLIAGGRIEKLRGRKTLDMLNELEKRDWITSEAREEMRASYCFLRHLEHRLQMIDDAQTHTMPQDEATLGVFASFAGFDSVGALKSQLQHHLECVEKHYAALFEQAPGLDVATGSLVFTGGEDDPDTTDTLRKMGFIVPERVSAEIRSWHFGRIAATRSARSRELLTDLVPTILAELAGTDNPDAAFSALAGFLANLPAGVQLFSLLKQNPNLLKLLAQITGTAPRLATYLSQRSRIFDAVIDPGFFDQLPSLDEIENAYKTSFQQCEAFEERLDVARVLTREFSFRIGVRQISGTLPADEAAAQYATIAEATIGALFTEVKVELEKAHGKIAGAKVAVIAMGKLGGREMSATSDIDLILLYDHDTDAQFSDGKKSLALTTYFSRLTQRLISALSVLTAEGRLYEVDMRLRPSGNSGPIATHIDGFVDYQRQSAWTWEKLALTRARVIAGEPEFCTNVADQLKNLLSQEADVGKITEDVKEMRQRLERERPPKGLWDLKNAPGGLIDIEFIAQYLQLVHANHHPEICHQNTGEVLKRVSEIRLVKPDVAHDLCQANSLYQRLSQIISLCVEGEFDGSQVPEGLAHLLETAGDASDFSELETTLVKTQIRIREHFNSIVIST